MATTFALVVPAMITAPPAPAVAESLIPVQPEAPGMTEGLSADVTLTAKKWGTSVGMICRWEAYGAQANGTAQKRWDYALWLVERDGTKDRVATWTAGEGDVVRTTDSTSVPVSDIARIELRAVSTGALLMARDVPAHASAG